MKRKIKAFTFVELLLALSIFSLIALSLYNTFSSGIQLNQRAEGTNRVYSQMLLSLETIAKDLENAVYYDFRGSYPQKFCFEGASDKISFYVRTKNGLKNIAYLLKPLEAGSIFQTLVGKHSSEQDTIVTRYEETDAAFTVVREEKAFIDSLENEASGKVASDILSIDATEDGLEFSFAYLEDQAGQPAVVFKNVWQEPYLPLVVRVSMTFRDSNQKEGVVTIQRDIHIPTGSWGVIAP